MRLHQSLIVLATLAVIINSCNEKSKHESGIAAAMIAPGPAADDSTVLAMVGGTPITLASLQIIAAQNGHDLTDPTQAKLALRDAVNLELLAAEAIARGYQNDPDIVRYVKTQSVKKLLLDTVDAADRQSERPAESELRTYYEANLAEFTSPTLARARVLALLKRPGKETAFQEKLDAVQAAIAANQLPFSELTTRFSDDPVARNQAGLTPWLVMGEPSKQFPDVLLDAVFASTDLTKVAGPIAHNDWIYFVQLTERREGMAKSFEEAEADIARRLHRQKRLQDYDRYVSQLEEKAEVRVFEEKLTGGVPVRLRPPGPTHGTGGRPGMKFVFATCREYAICAVGSKNHGHTRSNAPVKCHGPPAGRKTDESRLRPPLLLSQEERRFQEAVKCGTARGTRSPGRTMRDAARSDPGGCGWSCVRRWPERIRNRLSRHQGPCNRCLSA